MTTRPPVPTGGRVSFWQPGQGGLRVPRPPLRDGLPLRDIWARKKHWGRLPRGEGHSRLSSMERTAASSLRRSMAEKSRGSRISSRPFAAVHLALP